MFLTINSGGETAQLEFHARLVNEISEHEREWELSNEETGHLISVRFLEEANILKKIKTKSNEIVTGENILEELINDFLKKELERRQEGFDESEDNEAEEPQPYDPKKINIRNERWSLSHVYDLINKYEEIDLSPDFQRNFIWDRKRRSQLIESLMLRIPIPAFYLSETETGKFQVVDGLQRLSTIRDFFGNKFYLKGLEYLKEQEGRYFRDIGQDKGIDRSFVRTIQLTQINVNIIEAKSPAKVKYDVFRRVNTGGKPLNNQEIRNCMAEKDTRYFINELAFSDIFKKATGNSVKTTRMQAQEMVLRFISFWHERIVHSPGWEYTGNMTGYLDNSLERMNRNKTKNHEEIRQAFHWGMQNAYHLFGKYCFRKCLPEHLLPGAKKQLINKSLFTTWSVLLSQFPPNMIVSKTGFEAFAKTLADYLKNNEEYYQVVSYRTNDKKSIDTAFKETGKLIKEKLGL